MTDNESPKIHRICTVVQLTDDAYRVPSHLFTDGGMVANHGDMSRPAAVAAVFGGDPEVAIELLEWKLQRMPSAALREQLIADVCERLTAVSDQITAEDTF